MVAILGWVKTASARYVPSIGCGFSAVTEPCLLRLEQLVDLLDQLHQLLRILFVRSLFTEQLPTFFDRPLHHRSLRFALEIQGFYLNRHTGSIGVIPCGIKHVMANDDTSRTSLLIRCSRQDAQTVHAEASAQHRSVSGYLLYVLERSIWVDEKALRGLPYAIQITVPPPAEGRIAIHLRCTAEEAGRIRASAKRRLASISNFVVFSLHRHWKSVEKVRNSSPDSFQGSSASKPGPA